MTYYAAEVGPNSVCPALLVHRYMHGQVDSLICVNGEKSIHRRHGEGGGGGGLYLSRCSPAGSPVVRGVKMIAQRVGGRLMVVDRVMPQPNVFRLRVCHRHARAVPFEQERRSADQDGHLSRARDLAPRHTAGTACGG